MPQVDRGLRLTLINAVALIGVTLATLSARLHA
jgi:hypothetical protein